LLSSLGDAGFPVEYAREVDRHVWRDTYRMSSHVAYFWSLPSRSSTSNGIFGLKLLWSQLPSLVADIRRYTGFKGRSARDTLARWMDDPHYFWLRRSDQLRQAVSYARASQTDQWTSLDPENACPTYRREDIERALRRITWEDKSWSKYFDTCDVPVTELWYEDLARDPEPVLVRIAAILGVRRPNHWDSPLRPQADALSDAWVMSYRSGQPL
jgi:LPS sulfotransferase NodH